MEAGAPTGVIGLVATIGRATLGGVAAIGKVANFAGRGIRDRKSVV